MRKRCKKLRKDYMLMVLLFVITPFALGAYQPGTPGAPWTEEQAEIIRYVSINFIHF